MKRSGDRSQVRDICGVSRLRRRALGGIGACAAGGLLGGSGVLAQVAGSCVLAPEVGEGPFYFDPDLLRADIRNGRPGAALSVRLRVLAERSCEPIAGARVDLWQADGYGLYSGYTQQRGTGTVPASAVTGQNWLRGMQVTDDAGLVRFMTIFPSWYAGRTPHIHFKVLLGASEVVASQIFFPEEFNQEVMRRWDPYREHVHLQDTDNHNDRFLRDSIGGVFCNIDESRDDGYASSLEIAVRAI